MGKQARLSESLGNSAGKSTALEDRILHLMECMTKDGRAVSANDVRKARTIGHMVDALETRVEQMIVHYDDLTGD